MRVQNPAKLVIKFQYGSSMPTLLQLAVLPFADRPHWIATTTMTGRRNRNGRTSIARVNRAHEMRAVLALAPPGPVAPGDGTSHSGVTRLRPSRSKRKVQPRPVELCREKRSRQYS